MNVDHPVIFSLFFMIKVAPRNLSMVPDVTVKTYGIPFSRLLRYGPPFPAVVVTIMLFFIPKMKQLQLGDAI